MIIKAVMLYIIGGRQSEKVRGSDEGDKERQNTQYL